MKTPTIKTDRSITLHNDGTVSLWNSLTQQWERRADYSDEALVTLDADERVRVALYTRAHDVDADTVDAALALDRVPWSLLDFAGLDISDIAHTAAVHGDRVLARKAGSYLRRAA